MIAGVLTLSIVTLIIMIGGGALVPPGRAREDAAACRCGSAAILGGLVVGAMLAALVVIEANVDLRFVFANLTQPIGATLTFGQEMLPGLLMLLAISAGIGAVVAVLLTLPGRWRGVILLGAGHDGRASACWKARSPRSSRCRMRWRWRACSRSATSSALLLSGRTLAGRLLISAVPGLIAGVILGGLANGGGLAAGGVLRGNGSTAGDPRRSRSGSAILPLALIFAVVGMIGGLARSASRTFHNSMIYLHGHAGRDRRAQRAERDDGHGGAA